jgi:hypothetical protein
MGGGGMNFRSGLFKGGGGGGMGTGASANKWFG